MADFQRALEAQASLLKAQQQLVAARSATARTAIAVYRALGGGWEVRCGFDFVDAASKEAMQQRVDWGEPLSPAAIQPPGQRRWRRLPVAGLVGAPGLNLDM